MANITTTIREDIRQSKPANNICSFQFLLDFILTETKIGDMVTQYSVYQVFREKTNQKHYTYATLNALIYLAEQGYFSYQRSYVQEYCHMCLVFTRII